MRAASRAEKAAREALSVDANLGAASLVGATAAHRMHEYTRRDDWLSKVDAPEWQDARLLAAADMRADARDADARLPRWPTCRRAASASMRNRSRCAQQQLKNWAEVLKLAKALEKREALHPAAAVRLRQQAAENLLRERRHDPDALLEVWQSLSPAERQSPRLADLAADLLVPLERRNEARRIVEDALAHNWDARLLRRYPDTAGADALPLIQKAEGWKKDHPEDADLLFALGRLCQQQQLGQGAVVPRIGTEAGRQRGAEGACASRSRGCSSISAKPTRRRSITAKARWRLPWSDAGHSGRLLQAARTTCKSPEGLSGIRGFCSSRWPG